MEYIILAVVGTFILIGVVAYFIISKLRKEAWEGELIQKQEEVSSGSDYDTTNYVLYVKLKDGTDKRVAVKKKLYNELNVGDKVIKVQGETYPRRQF